MSSPVRAEFLSPSDFDCCIVLTTRGRGSGKTRHTMLEHAVMDGVTYIAPGWGLRTQWHLNILADPRVTVQRAGKTYGAIARRVTDDIELARLYGVTHGRGPVWKQYLDSWSVQDTVEDYVAKKDRLCVLRLDPTAGIPLPELHPDLVWIWPAALIVGTALWLAFC